MAATSKNSALDAKREAAAPNYIKTLHKTRKHSNSVLLQNIQWRKGSQKQPRDARRFDRSIPVSGRLIQIEHAICIQLLISGRETGQGLPKEKSKKCA